MPFSPDVMSTVGPIAAFMSSVTWSFAVSKYAQLTQVAPATAVNASRAVVGLAICLPFCLLYYGGLTHFMSALSDIQLSHIGWFSVAMFSGLAFGDVLFLWATRHIGIPTSLAIASIYPVWSALAGLGFLGQSISLHKIAGLIITVGGTMTVILADRRNHQLRTERPSGVLYAKGVGLAIATSLFWAMNAFATTKASLGLDFSLCILLRLSIGLGLCPIVSMALGNYRPLFLPWQYLRPVFYVFITEGFFGIALYLIGLKFSPLAVAATLSSLAPVLSVLFARLINNEAISYTKLVGIITVVTGLSLLML